MKKESIDFAKIEKKWQKKWADDGVFEVKENSKKKKYYVLEMFPYPSASFLHMGHVRNYTMGDVIARFKRMQGFNVLYPMGYDSFGLPAENAAKKAGEPPRKYVEFSIKKITEYFKQLGNSYDWSKTIATHKPEYYKWNQLFFLKFFEKGLVYRKKAPVNWCPSCNTVLANEEVEKGLCWRCDSEVIEKELDQWFFKTTDYADELLKDLDKLDWSDRLKAMQKNWIGRSEGTEILFKVGDDDWSIFTTRPDTIYGVTFMVVSAQHPKLMDLVTDDGKKDVDRFLKKIKKAEAEEDMDVLEKEGVFTGSYAVNPVNGEKIPVYAGNFVIADYGSGMVMAVPAHDQRDFEFAKKYKIPIKQVIAPLVKTTTGKDAIRGDKKTEEGDSVRAIVKHWKEDKYFCLDWPKFSWRSFVLGGVEKGETPEQAAIREVKEETGYHDIMSVKEIGFENHSHIFVEHKNINRYIRFKTFLIELKSDKRAKLEEEHTKHHGGKWIEKSKVGSYLNLPNDNYVWDIYVDRDRAFVDEGVLINSGEFDGMNSNEAIDAITEYLTKNKLGKKDVQYKLRDWLISRQRYWGTPIPVVYCDKCGVVGVKEKDLPVKLPEDVKFKGAKNPILSSKKFLDVKCPKCNGEGRRETDTMGGFMDSSWYFLRFCDSKNLKEPFDKMKIDYWMPVDQYIGGIEHAVGHLIYSRFFTKALRDLGYVSSELDEPFSALFNQGVVYGEDGRKMSKSYGNVVVQEEVAKKYGIDSARLFLLFVAAPDSTMEWNSKGIEGVYKFVRKVIEIKPSGKSDERSEHYRNKFIRDISKDIEEFRFNLAIIKLMKWGGMLAEKCDKKSFEDFLKVLSVFAPHIAEELWSKLKGKGFVSLADWPEVDEKKIDEKLEEAEKAVDKVVEDVMNVLRIVKEKGENPDDVYLYVMPNEVEGFDAGMISKRVGKKVSVFAVNDKKKYDPEGKSNKAKPGKPGVFVE